MQQPNIYQVTEIVTSPARPALTATLWPGLSNSFGWSALNQPAERTIRTLNIPATTPGGAGRAAAAVEHTESILFY
jgi:hypothetical protein